MSRTSGLVAVAAVAVTAAAVVSLTRSVPPPVVATDAATTVAVGAATLVCPGLPRAAQTQTSVLAVAPDVRLEQSGGSMDRAGTLGLSPLGRPEVDPTARRGVPLVQTFGVATAPATLVRGTAGTAPGLAATQWTVDSSSVSTSLSGPSGLAATRCDAASDSWWFSGVSTTIGTASRLVLTNPAPATAVVDLSFYGPAGVVEGVGARGIAVGAQSRTVLDLARYAPGLVDGTVSVAATAGRVVAALHVDLQEGLAPLGSEWVAPSDPPSAQVLVNATQAGADRRRLVVTNPGDREALVEVRLLDSGGPLVSTALDVVRLRPGQVVTEDLADVLGDTAAAVLLSSTSPITAGIVDEFEPTGARPADLSSAGASPQLGEPAVIPVLPGSRLSLALSSVDRAGGVVVVDVRDDEGSSLSSDRVNVGGLSNRTWPVAAPDASYVVVSTEPGGGIHASALYAGKDGATALPVVSGVYTATRPAVSAAP